MAHVGKFTNDIMLVHVGRSSNDIMLTIQYDVSAL